MNRGGQGSPGSTTSRDIARDWETDLRRRFPQTFFKIEWIPRIARDEEKELKPTPNWDDWDRMG
jgi:hypothetical protein